MDQDGAMRKADVDKELDDNPLRDADCRSPRRSDERNVNKQLL